MAVLYRYAPQRNTLASPRDGCHSGYHVDGEKKTWVSALLQRFHLSGVVFTTLWLWYVQPRTCHFPRLYVVYARLRPFQLEADVRPIAFSPWLPNSSVSAASSVLPSELCFPATRVTDGNWELVWIGFCAVCLSGRGTFSHVSHV